MTVQPNSIEARDAAYHMHSYTNARTLEAEGPLIIEEGDGIYVTDNSGKRYIEGMSGLWSVAVGFGEDRLAKVANDQMRKLPYYHTFAQRSHTPSAELAEKLIQMAPVPMSKVYFTNSGSEANDTMVKLLWYRSNALGKPEKKKIISRIKGYHGITVASGSLTGLPYNHMSFDLPIPQVMHAGCPHYSAFARDGETEADFVARLARELDDLIQTEGPDTIAGFIGEPVMGAGGVIVPPEGYWKAIQDVLKKYDILLIADEVICGFGRTGQMFGSQTMGIEPDIMVMSKQLSSSYIPFSALMMNDRTYQPIADETARIGTFGHGFTGSGHPVGAAVSLENLKIIEERDLVGNAARLSPLFLERLNRLAEHDLAKEMRGIGLIGALELHPQGDAVGVAGPALVNACMERGLILRPLGDSVAFCPPLIITEDQVNQMFDIVDDAIGTLSF
ncbi:aspartate aminotransferase family protein [Thalassovita sp.]|uniref:aspartate aminotransferase family protein n=1 Tax=Thalassovita sp. TaxID=1979401 RepID=UPI002B27BBDD|nr:aspartate aminotransferase family protein [Thalassovita sp.]